MKAYLANGLFSEADQLYNKFLATSIRDKFPTIDLYVPQENANINDKSKYADSLAIYAGDNHYLDEADIMIAVIDGSEIDPGVATEIGRYAILCETDKSKRRKIFGVYTDIRQQGRNNEEKINALISDGSECQFMYRNLYVIGAIKTNGYLATNHIELVNMMVKYIND